jgi:hypothetical protein
VNRTISPVDPDVFATNVISDSAKTCVARKAHSTNIITEITEIA